MILTTIFTDGWVPTAWLSPVVTILNVNKSIVVIDKVPMTEVWLWFYKYDFKDYKEEIDYAMLFDWWDSLNNTERFKVWGNENNTKLAEIAGNTSLTLVNSAKANNIIDYNKIQDMVKLDLPKMDLIEQKVSTIDELQEKFNKMDKLDSIMNSITELQESIKTIKDNQDDLELWDIF